MELALPAALKALYLPLPAHFQFLYTVSSELEIVFPF